MKCHSNQTRESLGPGQFNSSPPESKSMERKKSMEIMHKMTVSWELRSHGENTRYYQHQQNWQVSPRVTIQSDLIKISWPEVGVHGNRGMALLLFAETCRKVSTREYLSPDQLRLSESFILSDRCLDRQVATIHHASLFVPEVHPSKE